VDDEHRPGRRLCQVVRDRPGDQSLQEAFVVGTHHDEVDVALVGNSPKDVGSITRFDASPPSRATRISRIVHLSLSSDGVATAALVSVPLPDAIAGATTGQRFGHIAAFSSRRRQGGYIDRTAPRLCRPRLVLLVLMVCVAGLAGCSGEDEVAAPPATGFDGGEIHVGGVVTRVRNMHALDLGRGSRERVVVITREEHDLQVGQRAEAVGRLERLDVPVLARQLGIELSPEAFADVQGQPVLVSERVHRR
jgi:hypothetical protein